MNLQQPISLTDFMELMYEKECPRIVMEGFYDITYNMRYELPPLRKITDWFESLRVYAHLKIVERKEGTFPSNQWYKK